MTSVLIVITGADHWTLTDGTQHPTGFWAEELLTPVSTFRKAGIQLTFATPGGVRPTVDEGSLSPDTVGGAEEAARQRAELDVLFAEELAAPLRLEDVKAADYDAVYVPGGHGPMEDLAVSPAMGELLVGMLDAGKIVSSVCHGPAALLSATRADGEWAFRRTYPVRFPQRGGAPSRTCGQGTVVAGGPAAGCRCRAEGRRRLGAVVRGRRDHRHRTEPRVQRRGGREGRRPAHRLSSPNWADPRGRRTSAEGDHLAQPIAELLYLAGRGGPDRLGSGEPRGRDRANILASRPARSVQPGFGRIDVHVVGQPAVARGQRHDQGHVDRESAVRRRADDNRRPEAPVLVPDRSAEIHPPQLPGRNPRGSTHRVRSGYSSLASNRPSPDVASHVAMSAW